MTKFFIEFYYFCLFKKKFQLLPSLNRSTSVRINIYGGYPPIVTANCAPVIRQNVYSSNGVAHIVGQVLPSAEATLANIIDKDPQFSILRTCKYLYDYSSFFQSIKILRKFDDVEHSSVFKLTEEG